MFNYKKRRQYKYKLYSDVVYETDYKLDNAYDNGLISISVNGLLTICAGYSWDGPSGPTLDTKNFMRGSLVHDALYQLMREKILPQSAREEADNILREICIKSGMSTFRAWYIYKGVRLAGASAAKPDLLSAP